MKELQQLKKDIANTEHYKSRLLKQGKNAKAYKMQKKLDHLQEVLEEVENELLH
jgi:hypothetical protein